mgnify:CR=1 FL=1
MTEEDGRRQARRSRRRRRFALAVAGLACLAVALAWLMPSLEGGNRYIDYQRKKNALLWAFGFTLPGTPDLSDLDGRLAAKGLALGAPVFMRIFKREFELEVWLKKDGRFELLSTYPICRWSGDLGPKLATGDRQAPEGFYSVGPSSLNPKSRWHRSFNLGFPNAYDRALGRTGSFLMVHGGCGSIGCYAMTNAAIDEIWRIVNRAFDGGQNRFQVQVFPFRMTEANLAAHRGSPWDSFWMNLKPGYDLFEAERIPPQVGLCGKSYAFASGSQSADKAGPVTSQCIGASKAAAVGSAPH